MQLPEAKLLAHAREDLVRQLSGTYREEAVRAAFERAQGDFDGAAVRTYLPVLVPRRARQALADA